MNLNLNFSEKQNFPTSFHSSEFGEFREFGEFTEFTEFRGGGSMLIMLIIKFGGSMVGCECFLTNSINYLRSR